jgi:hypothetical protein
MGPGFRRDDAKRNFWTFYGSISIGFEIGIKFFDERPINAVQRQLRNGLDRSPIFY